MIKLTIECNCPSCKGEVKIVEVEKFLLVVQTKEGEKFISHHNLTVSSHMDLLDTLQEYTIERLEAYYSKGGDN